ncbi:MAG: hypothetical protein WB626_08045 [Bacteroidota bacterium]
MGFRFRPTDMRKLARVLGCRAARRGSCYRFTLGGGDPARGLALEIFPDIPIGNRRGSLVSVYTGGVHLQLHFCSGYVLSTLLGEATFVGEHDGRLSGLIVERGGGASLYANVDRTMLSGDFTRLGPEVMLSGIALSLADGILDGPSRTLRGGPPLRGRRKKA